jgi:hypothetical protein
LFVETTISLPIQSQIVRARSNRSATGGLISGVEDAAPLEPFALAEVECSVDAEFEDVMAIEVAVGQPPSLVTMVLQKGRYGTGRAEQEQKDPRFREMSAGTTAVGALVRRRIRRA